MPRTFDYVSDIEAANRESGGHFFDPKTLKFFGSRVYPEVYPLPEEVGGAYFITSEKRRGEPRACTVRYAGPDGDVRTVGEFMVYNLRGARSAIDCLLADTRRALRLCPDPAPFIRAFTGDALATFAKFQRDPVDAPDRKVDDSEPCADCKGHGYTALAPQGEGHVGAELEPCDSCPSTIPESLLPARFVSDLERGDLHARDVARFLIRNGAPAFALEV